MLRHGRDIDDREASMVYCGIVMAYDDEGCCGHGEQSPEEEMPQSYGRFVDILRHGYEDWRATRLTKIDESVVSGEREARGS